MQCPVCKHNEISPFATACPNCDADLVQFKLLDTVEEGYINAVKERIATEGDLLELEKQQKKELSASRRRGNNYLLLLFLLPLIYFICGKKHIPTKPKIIEVQQLDSLFFYKKKCIELQEKLNKGDGHGISSIRYIIRKGDKLENLALMFFGDKEIWKNIKEDNEIPDEHEMIPGDTIFINLKYGL